MDPSAKGELLEYEWRPADGVSARRFSNGHRVVRNEPTHPSHNGWDASAARTQRPTRVIHVGDRVERSDGTAYYV